ncbi:MAG: hypothetical protein SGARI_005602, partial [Bacillariaceae sp.]
MPKGPVHPGHVLLVPVTHTSEGAWNLGDEWITLVEKLQQHAAQVYDMDLFVFERSMMTKGGYHTHVQVVPVPRDKSTQLQTTMLAHAKASGFDLRPIQSDLGAKNLISKDDSYFYAEIRTRSQSFRFFYRHDAGDSTATSVPLQFAREVLASVLENPKLAHWKACVVDKEQETQLATEFRDSFNASMGRLAVAASSLVGAVTASSTRLQQFSRERNSIRRREQQVDAAFVPEFSASLDDGVEMQLPVRYVQLYGTPGATLSEETYDVVQGAISSYLEDWWRQFPSVFANSLNNVRSEIVADQPMIDFESETFAAVGNDLELLITMTFSDGGGDPTVENAGDSEREPLFQDNGVGDGGGDGIEYSEATTSGGVMPSKATTNSA